MRRMKNIFLVLVAVILVLPSSLVIASSTDSKPQEKTENQDGNILTKDEVIYGTLQPTGERQKIYVVNTLDVTKAGTIVDYGTYSSLKNLTDLSEIEQKDNTVQFTAPEGKFYYQGNMEDAALPWDFSISYVLDGKDISPQELAGEDGELQIRMQTSENEAVDPVFFENYLLQIDLTFDADITSSIKTDEGMIANAGKNKQVTFTVMPEQEEELIVTADVVDFELEGIDISGVPSSMSIDAPDVDEMTGEMKTLSGAIADINDGVGELSDGVSELNNGVADLRDGSAEYKRGITELDESSAELVDGSKQMAQALQTMSSSLASLEDIDLSELEQVTEGFSQLSNGLEETAGGLEELQENYMNAYNALDSAMEAIPATDITEEDIQDLYQSGADQEIVDQLVETYTAAQVAKGTYTEVKEGFKAVDTTLETVIGSLNEMVENINTVEKELATSLGDMDITEGFGQLQEGIDRLSTNYQTFHAGLLDYTGGVSQLSSSYAGIHNGIGELSKGMNELKNGVGELHDGITTLHQSTSDLPKQMTEEIDQMMADYDKSDFEAVSFVSPDNQNIETVQFVLKTEGIKKEEPETAKEPEEEKKGIWARFKELFS